MPKPYIAEARTAHWTSDGIRDGFKAAGFDVRDWPLTQHLERQVPADWAFFSPKFSKLFGLQYKTLYRNGTDFWRLSGRLRLPTIRHLHPCPMRLRCKLSHSPWYKKSVWSVPLGGPGRGQTYPRAHPVRNATCDISGIRSFYALGPVLGHLARNESLEQ